MEVALDMLFLASDGRCSRDLDWLQGVFRSEMSLNIIPKKFLDYSMTGAPYEIEN